MQFIDYAIVAVYLAIMVFIGLWLQKKASSGIDSYFLGNRSIPWWVLGASGMSSNLDVTGTMINTALLFALGMSGFFVEIRGGVTLVMAFLMIFMGKWNRRSQVMTLAEWMHFRFGKNKSGDVARIISAVGSIIITIAMVTYFCKGAGKFVAEFLGIPPIMGLEPDFWAALLMIILAMIYTVASGLYGVVWTDLFQSFFVFATIIIICFIAFTKSEYKLPDTFHLSAPVSEQKLIEYNKKHPKKKISVGSTIGKYRVEEIRRRDALFRGKDIKNVEAIMQQLQRKIITSTNLMMHLSEKTKGFLSKNDTKAFKGSFLSDINTLIKTKDLSKENTFAFVVKTKEMIKILNAKEKAKSLVLLNRMYIEQAYGSKLAKGPKYIVWKTTKDEWTGAKPRGKFDFPSISDYSMFNLIGLLLFFYMVKVTMEGCGGTNGYMAQRYFAAKNDKEAGLLSLFWTFLLSFRWPFTAAIAIMGIALGASSGAIGDPERVLPMVIDTLIPSGLKGLLVAGLMAAAMSTFDSTVNGGAAYWVKDIYQAYLKPKATEKQLMFHSRMASIIIVLIALICSLAIKNINEIWGWITMGIGAGMFVPQIVRWYWWRLNGWGFAIGTAVGMIVALVQKALLPEGTPEYISFSLVIGSSFIGTVVGTFLTEPTDDEVLENFYKRTRPFGVWGKVRRKLSDDFQNKVNKENRRDIIGTFFAVPWQLVLFMMWMMVIMRRWDQFSVFISALVVLTAGLYFFWFRHLDDEVEVEEKSSE